MQKEVVVVQYSSASRSRVEYLHTIMLLPMLGILND